MIYVIFSAGYAVEDAYLEGPDNTDLKALETEFFETYYKTLKKSKTDKWHLSGEFVAWLIQVKGFKAPIFPTFVFNNEFAEQISSIGRGNTTKKIANLIGRSVEWVKQFID